MNGNNDFISSSDIDFISKKLDGVLQRDGLKTLVEEVIDHPIALRQAMKSLVKDNNKGRYELLGVYDLNATGHVRFFDNRVQS